MKRIIALLFLIYTLFATPSHAEMWSFAVVADNRSAFNSYRNVLEEIKSRSEISGGEKATTVFVIGCGDISPVPENHAIYKEVFPTDLPRFLPVKGNHENDKDTRFIFENILPGYGSAVKLYDQNGVNYFSDWKNVRIIVLDQYSKLASNLRNPILIQWLEEAIRTAADADHIFLAFHDPYLPGDPMEDSFWKVLLKNKDKVRAIVNGHTHRFARRRIPDEPGGIYYINAGNAGWQSHSDGRQTFVEVAIDGKKVAYRAVQAENETRNFRITDEWKVEAPGRVDGSTGWRESQRTSRVALADLRGRQTASSMLESVR